MSFLAHPDFAMSKEMEDAEGKYMSERIISLYKKVSNIAKLLSIGSLILAMTGCQPQVQVDKSILEDQPCTVPCWYNIVPGISTETDVRSELEKNPTVRKRSVEYDQTSVDGIPLEVFSWTGSGTGLNRLYLQNGIVIRIDLRIQYDLTLEDLVNKYGAPEQVYTRLSGTDFWNYLVVFSYPSLGIQVSSFQSRIDPDKFVVQPGIGLLSQSFPINDVVYFEPMSYQDMLINVFFLGEDGSEYWMRNSHTWQGFGQTPLAK